MHLFDVFLIIFGNTFRSLEHFVVAISMILAAISTYKGRGRGKVFLCKGCCGGGGGGGGV